MSDKFTEQDIFVQALTEIALEDVQQLEQRLDSSNPPVKPDVLEDVFKQHRGKALRTIRKETAKRKGVPFWKVLSAAACFIVVIFSSMQLLRPVPPPSDVVVDTPKVTPSATLPTEIPEDWHGNYYVLDVPDAFALEEITEDEALQIAAFIGEGAAFQFTEHAGEQPHEPLGESAVYQYIELSSGAVALHVTLGDETTLIWTVDGQTLTIAGQGITKETVAQIASGVKKIK